MLFVLFWFLGYDLTVSTVNSISCILMYFSNLFTSVHVISSIICYLLFDIVTMRIKRRSELVHHILGIISALYAIWYLPTYLDTIIKVLMCLETSTIFLNMYLDSKSTKSELHFISKLLSPAIWSYLFLFSFIVCRFILFEIIMYPILDRSDIIVFHLLWLGLNSYWLLWMINKFVYHPFIHTTKRSK